ncbi:MAG: glycoside hydrolase family 71 protein [Rhodococcus sp. (in: high G+C Gram-positive bacteria)]
MDGATVVGQPDPTSDSDLPFDIPADTGEPPKKVFAHYFPPYPISLDNVDPAVDYYATHYLDPDGEGGQYRQFGGFLRDRPIPRDPRPENDWVSADLRDEVRQAKSAGIDGFSVDVLAPMQMGDFSVASRPAALLSAAQDVDPSFSIMLMPDMSGMLASLSPEELAEQMAALAVYPSAFRLDDGAIVISPFRAETKTPDWWQQFSDAMLTLHGQKVALVPVFVDSSTDLTAYAAASYGMSSWGARNPAFNEDSDPGPQTTLGQAKKARALGKLWMAPVSVQDARPSQSIFDEAANTENLRQTWQNARASDSEWVQLVTWNDYSEGTAFAPSVLHGWAFLDMSSYWLWWFKNGSPPPVVRDTVYLTHRTQLTTATTQIAEQSPMVLRPGSTPAIDRVEALVFSTSPGTAKIRTSAGETECAVPAGVGICTAPLAPGPVSAELARDSKTVVSVDSKYIVESSPVVQTLDYVAVSSRR